MSASQAGYAGSIPTSRSSTRCGFGEKRAECTFFSSAFCLRQKGCARTCPMGNPRFPLWRKWHKCHFLLPPPNRKGSNAMKLIANKICRKRYKVRARLRKWITGGRWGWDTGKPKRILRRGRTSTKERG